MAMVPILISSSTEQNNITSTVILRINCDFSSMIFFTSHMFICVITISVIWQGGSIKSLLKCHVFMINLIASEVKLQDVEVKNNKNYFGGKRDKKKKCTIN